MRVGIGHDTHRFRNWRETLEARKKDPTAADILMIGGVAIPYEKALLGHSDADVLLHAVTDALIGAAGLGDIGDHFPDSAEENRGRDSAEFLKIAHRLIREKGWRVVNLDSTIFAQAPKMSPYKLQIRDRIAQILDMSPENVNVKAKTGEGIGMIGRGEAISAEAIVLLSAGQQ